MTVLDEKIADLNARVTATKTVSGGVKTIISELLAMLLDAINAAMNAGATSAQMKPITDLASALTANTEPCCKAILANTPYMPPVVETPAPVLENTPVMETHVTHPAHAPEPKKKH